ncbi:hypothetical protein [Tenacibaculum sp. nBUS_03]|uniref:hypothetical protein n=1 Tax=Tenacibaculum sp. nBUS_03 TaxID=3395320 RepID=UPI003EBF0117
MNTKFLNLGRVLKKRELFNLVSGAAPPDCEGGQVLSPIYGICMDPSEVGGINVDGCSDIGIP